MHRSSTIFLVPILILSYKPDALSGGGGSGYSRYGLGDIRYFATSRAMGMGGASIAVLSTNAIDRVNPAGWVQINRTRFSVSVLSEGFSSTDGASSAFLSSANFNGFMLAIPVVPASGIVFGAGITPYSEINYNIVSALAPAGLDYTLKYVGDGGLSQGHIGLSTSITKELHLGMKLNYYFGTLQHVVSQLFSTSDYTSVEVTRSSKLNGVGVTLGSVYSGLGKIFSLPESQAFTIGAVATTTTYLRETGEHFFRYTQGNLITYDTTTATEQIVRLPYALGIGISYLGDRFMIASDLYYQNWGKFSGNTFYGGDLRDSYRLGVGGELIPKRDGTATFTQRLAYRLGFFYTATYYRVKGEAIDEIGFTGGIGLPIFEETRLNIAAEYSLRGTTNQQLQKDRILRISFTLSGSELWFVRPAEE